MRLFPGDEVPALSAFPDEMRSPWILPPVPRAHRDRLAMLVGRALARFDRRVRVVSLRWIERRWVEEGRLRLPEQPVVWWRIEAGVKAADVLRKAPAAVSGMHLYDFEEPPDIASVGWLGPLKVQLLHRLTDAIAGERPFEDTEAVIDRLADAAERLVSPIDLLDFAERLIETRTSGLPLYEGEADGYAVVIASRFAPESPSRPAASAFVASLEAAVRGGPLPGPARTILGGAWLLEPGLGERGPLLEADVLGLPRGGDSMAGAGTVIDRVAWRVGGVRGAALPAEEARAPKTETSPDLDSAAERVLEDLRAGRDRAWSEEDCRGAVRALLEFAAASKAGRRDRLTPALLEREAVLHQEASEILVRLGDSGAAAEAALEAARRWFDAYRPEEALAAVNRTFGLDGDVRTKAAAHVVRGALHRYQGHRSAARGDLFLAVFQCHEDGTPTSDLLQAQAYEELATLHLAERDLPKARSAAEVAIRLYRKADDALGRARALGLRVEVHVRDNQLSPATRDLEEAIKLAQRAHGRRELGRLLLRRGGLRRRAEDLSLATADYDGGLRLFEQIDDRRGRAEALLALGILKRRNNQLAEAVQDNALALSLFKQVQDRAGEGRALAERAVLRLAAGDLDGGSADCAAAKELFQQLEYDWGLALTTEIQARIDRMRGRLEWSRVRFDDAAARYAQLHDAWGQSNALVNAAELLALLGQTDRAREVARGALSVASATQNRSAVERATRVLSHLEKAAPLSPPSPDPPSPASDQPAPPERPPEE